MIDRKRPARRLQALDRWIHDWAGSEGETAGRLRRRIGVIALGAMLERSITDDGEPRFLVKGGSALELRFTRRARVSKDVDLVFRGAVDEAIDHLHQAVEDGWEPFTARVRDPEPLTIPWSGVAGLRVDVQLFYIDRPFITLSLELVTSAVVDVEHVATISLAPVGLTGPETIPCLSLRYQVAEKLHACSDPLDGARENDRAGDLMDLILIEDLTDLDTELAEVREACVEVFEHRDRQPWPPVVRSAAGWPAMWRSLVEVHDFSVTGIDEAVGRVNALIADIDASA